jgi:hypothetical protein
MPEFVQGDHLSFELERHVDPVIRVTAVQVCGSGMRNTPYRLSSVTGRAYWRWSRAAE